MNIQRWNLAITPLSPVHMGTDADYEPTGYVIDKGVLYEFDGLAALPVLPDVERKRLDAILNGRATQDMLLQVQAFFYGNRERLTAVSRNQVQVSPEMEAFYQERVGHVSQHETGGRRVQNKLEIERTAWNPVTQQATMPGTGLKGAIRTALLNAENNGRSLGYSLRNDRQANRKLQEELFQGKFHTDPLRLMSLGDANLNQPYKFTTQIRFALNRKKQAITDVSGNLRQSKAEQAGLYQLLECLPAMLPRAFSGTLTLQQETQMPRGKWPELQFRLADIAKACNAFYGKRLNQEMALLKQRGYVDEEWSSQLSSLLSQPWLKKAMKESRSFLLRAGRHSGAESVTLNGIRNIKIMQGRGEKPDYANESKTLWLAGDERQLQTNMQPFGWMLVEPFLKESELPAWPEQAINTEILQWQNTIQRRHQETVARLEAGNRAANEKRLMEERQRTERLAAEKARQLAETEEAERKQTEFDALSENLKAIYSLNGKLELLKSQPKTLRDTANINNVLKPLRQTAPNWPDPGERDGLADFMEAYYDLIGWHQTGVKSDKKKKQEKKKQELIQRIRQGS